MKFFSKASNYCLVLKPGLPGNRFTGEAAKPGVYVKFQHGTVDINNPEHVELMLSHPKFGTDFFQPDSPVSADPYGHRRQGDPQHDIIEFEYGQPKKRVASAPQVDPKLMNFIEKQAAKMAEEKFDKLVEILGSKVGIDLKAALEGDSSAEPSEPDAPDSDTEEFEDMVIPEPIEQQVDDEKISDEELEPVVKKAPSRRKTTSNKKNS